ncbi:MAG: hypothetical protein BMS9Abin37_0525 [Acidobacteriota bacterium]|nr:MAG: hypothetical protein BMS9Abin37_0525 [Acidobacteriota bacterium]
MKRVILLIFALALVALSADERERSLVVGEKGVIHIETEMRAGDLVLQRGRYRVEHRVEGDVHFIKFTLLFTPYRRESRRLEREVRCTIVPLKTKAGRTAIFTVQKAFVDGNTHVFFDEITRMEIRGENVAHVFPKGEEAEWL